MSDAHSQAAHSHGEHHEHEEHLETWPDAGITETAKAVPMWLIAVYLVMASGMVVAYLDQFFWHSDGYPKYGPGYAQVTENEQFPDKITPKIELASTVTWRAGEQAQLLLKASGGRVGRIWSLGAEGGALPPGIEMKQVKTGFALAGTPTAAGEYNVRLVCRSGSGEAQHDLTIVVEEAAAQ